MYQVTITNADGTAEHYMMTSDDAYALVMDELQDPTPGTVEVNIRRMVGE